MKPVDCIPEDAIADVREAPAGDPRRRHLETCPRCRALLVSYETFLAPDAAHAAAYGESEKRVLDAARARLLGDSTASPAPDAGAPRSPWWAALLAPRLRPAWALAALAVLATTVVLMPRGPLHREPAAVRGVDTRPLAPATPAFEADGSVRLSWTALAGAERYEVRLFTAALEPAGVVDAGADTSVRVPAGRLRDAFGPGGMLLWRVVAFQGGDALETSGTQTLQRP